MFEVVLVATPAQERARTRMLTVEVLRVCALLGIAVFHTFQNWFGAVATGEAPSWGVAATFYQPTSLAVMGCIDQLGAWGNHVFFLISGYFLLPSALRDARSGDGTGQIADKTAHRVSNILATVAFYVVTAWVVSHVAPQAELVSMTGVGWLAQGLQFVWLYLAFVLMCPILGRGLAHRQRYVPVALAVAILVVYAANIYIAYFEPGDEHRTLWEWRKLMSGITYGLSFLAGGYMGESGVHEGKRWGTKGSAVVLAMAVLTTILAEVHAAVQGDLPLLTSLSYKSTSPFAFAMAIAALAFAVSLPSDAATHHPRLARACAYLTSGMLGFYVLQALFSQGWHRLISMQLGYAIDRGFGAFALVGTLLSVVLFLVLVSVDVLVRQPIAAQIAGRWHGRQ